MASKSDSKELRSESKAAIAARTRPFDLVPLESFDTTRFPTNAEVLRRIFFLSDLSNSTPLKSKFDFVFNEMEDIYKKALAIQRSTKQKLHCIDQFSILYQDFKVTACHFKQNRKQSPKDKFFLENLHKLCDISPPDAEKQIRNDRLRSQRDKDRDIAFLNDQRTLRKDSLANVDPTYSKKSEAKFKRDLKISNLQKQVSSSASISSFHEPKQKTLVGSSLEPTLPRLRSRIQPTGKASAPENKGSGSEDEAKNEAQFRFSLKPSNDPDYVESRFLRDRPKKKNLLSADSLVLKAADRGNTSSRKLTSLVGAVLVEGGEDLNDHVISHMTIHRNRPMMRAATATNIKKSFVPPKRAGVHFDGKKVEFLNGESGETLAVMLTGDTPQCQSGKLLSARLIRDSSGKEQAEEVIRALKEWKVEMNVVSMCFDTTSSNTGWINGAATRIEKYLAMIQNRPLLWGPCRHHIPELFLKAVWEALFGEDMAPHYLDFEKFKKIFKDLDKSKYETLPNKKWMVPIIKHIVEFCQHLLSTEKQPRDDYKEVLDLTLALLGSPPKDFNFKACGAYHKARWMAPLIYSFKMCSFRAFLPKEIASTKAYLAKLEQFVTFATLFYVEYWFCTQIASDAPYMDLNFYKNMLQYKKTNKIIADAVLEKFYGHTWYLNQCYAPLSLFSKNVSSEEKAEIANKLLKVKPPKKYSTGYPMPVPLSQFTVKDGLALRLSDFVDTESLFMFDCFDFKKDWLDKPVDTWENYESFKEMENFVRNLKLTNDTAERGVKLVTDYCKTLTKDSEDLQNLMQVVEQHRGEYKDVKKTTLNKASRAKE